MLMHAFNIIKLNTNSALVIVYSWTIQLQWRLRMKVLYLAFIHHRIHHYLVVFVCLCSCHRMFYDNQTTLSVKFKLFKYCRPSRHLLQQCAWYGRERRIVRYKTARTRNIFRLSRGSAVHGGSRALCMGSGHRRKPRKDSRKNTAREQKAIVS